jgi:hypothetical protein
MNNQEAVPRIILAAADLAVAAYLDYFSEGKWSPNMLKVWGQHARRVFGGRRAFTLWIFVADVKNGWPRRRLVTARDA